MRRTDTHWYAWGRPHRPAPPPVNLGAWGLLKSEGKAGDCGQLCRLWALRRGPGRGPALLPGAGGGGGAEERSPDAAT